MQQSALALMIFTVAPALSLAQPSQDWDSLARLRAGRKIRIVDMKGKRVEGQFARYSGEAVTIRSDRGELSIPRGEVSSIRARRDRQRLRNTLLGLGIGAAAGLAIGAVRGATYHEAGETGVFILVWTPIGAGVGAGLGAALPPGEVTVYRAPGRTND